MKKFVFLLMASFFLTACGFGNNNKVALINQEEDEEGAVIQDDLSDLVYDFEYESNNDDFTNLNIWVDQYVNGEKMETVHSLTNNLADVEEDDGQLSFFLNNIVPEHSEGENIDFQLAINQDEDTVNSSLTDTDIAVDSEYSIAYGPVLSDDGYTLTDDEEVVAAMVALNEDSRMPSFNLEPDMPANIDFDEHIKDIAGDVDVLYIMKIQFTEEI